MIYFPLDVNQQSINQCKSYSQALPYIEEDNKCCVVINGLNAILKEQEERFGDRCITINDDVVKILNNEENSDVVDKFKAQVHVHEHASV